MRLRQEQVVFLVAVLVLGLLAWRAWSAEGAGGSRIRAGTPADTEVERLPAPDVARALPREGAAAIERDLLAPPSDTRPLPPLGLVEPPRSPLPGLLPPPEPGPAPEAWALLRRPLALDVEPEEAAAAFASGEGAGEVDYDAELFAADEDEGELDLLADLRQATGDDAAETDPLADLRPEERRRLLEQWKATYDWAWTGARHVFGRIQNPDRFGLAVDPKRAGEPLTFVEVDPLSGAERFGGQPYDVPRDTVEEWAFAATPANELELAHRRLGPGLARSDYADALALAARAVEHRLDAPRALAIAEDLYRRLAEFDPDDLAPRLGLARAHEAGFRLDEAMRALQEARERFPNHAEPLAHLGRLQARLLLLREAEASLRAAVALDRGSWEARWLLGRFLAERGRHADALAELEQANRFVPTDPAALEERIAVRVDLADAKLALGRLGEARSLYASVLGLDASQQRARAGWLATELLAPAAELEGGAPPPEPADAPSGLELELAEGLAAMLAGDVARSHERLAAAGAADPLRAHLAHRALSRLAEVAGLPEEAMAWIERALEVHPRDAWSLYQRGRLLADAEDLQGARASLLAALDVELDFSDALAALGEMSYRLGRFADAERYLARAVEIEPHRAELHALRGLNALLLESVPDARASFERGLEATDGLDPVCRAGLAWCTYLSGDTEEAMVALSDLDDSLRGLPDDAPIRVWARAQLDRIREHEEKVVWSDAFARKEIRNGWEARETPGVRHRIVDEELVLEGVFDRADRTLLHRVLPASMFVSFEADVWVDPTTRAHVGLVLARERERRGETELLASAAVRRHADGSLQVTVQRQGAAEEVVDLPEPFPTGRWVRLRIERSGDASDARVTLLADGVPLVEDARMPSLRAETPVVFGLFAEGDPGRPVSVRMDRVELVRRDVR